MTNDDANSSEQQQTRTNFIDKFLLIIEIKAISQARTFMTTKLSPNCHLMETELGEL